MTTPTCENCPVLIHKDTAYKCNHWGSVRGPLVLQQSANGTVYPHPACLRNNWRESAEANERRKRDGLHIP